MKMRVRYRGNKEMYKLLFDKILLLLFYKFEFIICFEEYYNCYIKILYKNYYVENIGRNFSLDFLIKI